MDLSEALKWAWSQNAIRDYLYPVSLICACNSSNVEQDEQWQREALTMRGMNHEELREAVDKIGSEDEMMTKLLALLFHQITRAE